MAESEKAESAVGDEMKEVPLMASAPVQQQQDQIIRSRPLSKISLREPEKSAPSQKLGNTLHSKLIELMESKPQ